MSDTQGRRPTGPGAYLYEIERVGVSFDCLVHYDWRGEKLLAAWIGDMAMMCGAEVAAMPGTFTPLSPPVAAPEPSWDDAPEWAMWWAAEEGGNSRWWQREPVLTQSVFLFWHSEWLSRFAGRVDLPIGVDWRTTLRKRPEVQGE